jgi:hypothetical protein
MDGKTISIHGSSMDQFFVIPFTSAPVSTEPPTQWGQGYKQSELEADNSKSYVYTMVKHEEKGASYTRIPFELRLTFYVNLTYYFQLHLIFNSCCCEYHKIKGSLVPYISKTKPD